MKTIANKNYLSKREISCLHCGILFQTVARNHKFCSEECYKATDKLRYENQKFLKRQELLRNAEEKKIIKIQKRKEYLKKYYQINKEKIAERFQEIKETPARVDSRRKHHLKKHYGITNEQYSELLEKQNDCCALCKRHKSEFTNFLSVDHDHKTGEIRGLLCTHCNHRIIGRHTDPTILRNAADYVEFSRTGWFVPKKTKKRKRKEKFPKNEFKTFEGDVDG